MLAKARSSPSDPRTTSTPVLPIFTARWSPGSASSATRPAHTQPSSKNHWRSHASTASSTYAARGSMRLLAEGLQHLPQRLGVDRGRRPEHHAIFLHGRRQRAARRSASTAREACQPGMPQTPPPPWVAEWAW